ncbi:MAG TPA: hypothetical protein VK563_17055, partial [Puia sp.]|nr:hypothetical protein [Puia sp.]
MTKFYFSILIGCSLLTTQAKAQTPDTDIPVSTEAATAPFFYAYTEPNSNMVKLRWQISSEFNTDHFVLERATDGVHFAPLHELVASGAKGQGPAYDDLDNSLAGQMGYYRLKIVLKDGNAFYSPVATVDMTGKIAPELKPGVVHIGSTVRLNVYYGQPVTVNFFNSGGNLAGSYMVNSTSFDINTSNWGK